ncbi:MAG: UPF0175 family protein [Chloroflexi bacterium]|nr:UPF0175 family protein [Chloroflexota bacterium]
MTPDLGCYAKQYAEGKMSAARAAEEAGVSLWEMMEYLRSKRIPSQYDFDEWLKDVETVERRVEARRGPPRRRNAPERTLN